MAKQDYNKKKTNKDSSEEDASYSPGVNKIFKVTVRIMSWFVGLVFIFVILLPQLNSPFWDEITRIIFLVGIVDLIIVLLIEFFADRVKQLLTRVFDDQIT